MRNWKNEFIENAVKVFSEGRDARESKANEKEMEQDRNDLLAKVGQLTIEVDWLKKNLQKSLDLITRRNLLSVHSELSVTRQSELLDVNRISVYYVSATKDLEHENQVKERLDYWHTKMPYLGVRKLKIKLKEQDGIKAGRKFIKRCMAGKARWVDNVIIERWFRSFKTEYIYINELETPKKLRAGIAYYPKSTAILSCETITLPFVVGITT